MSCVQSLKVLLGDVVKVQDDRLNIELYTQIIAYDWDCLLKKFTNIQFGNFRKKLSNLIPTIKNDVKKSVTSMGVNVEGYVDMNSYYYIGDTAEISGIIVNGILATKISFTVQLPKIADGLAINVTELKCNAFNINGTYCFGSYVSGGYDVANDGNITISATSDYRNVTIELTGTFTGTNNTPINVELNSLKLEFEEDTE